MGSYLKEHWEAMRNPTQLRASKQGSSSPDQPKANVSKFDASCSHAMRSVRRDRASAAGCATTRATTTTRDAAPTAMHAGLRMCIVGVGNQGQQTTTKSSQEQPMATKSSPEKQSGCENMIFFLQGDVFSMVFDFMDQCGGDLEAVNISIYV